MFQLTIKKPDGSPDIGNFLTINMREIRERWIMHPDNDVDLCVLPIESVMKYGLSSGTPFYYTVFEEDLLPTQEKLDSCAFLEDVIMIGYPIGLLDEANNLPIIRRGVTATHPKYNYNHRKEFLIDIACFPGSSGSPIFMLREGSLLDHMQGVSAMPFHLLFLGILYAGPQYTVNGEIISVVIPTVSPTGEKVASKIRINIGFVIKAERLLDFSPIVEEASKKNRP